MGPPYGTTGTEFCARTGESIIHKKGRTIVACSVKYSLVTGNPARADGGGIATEICHKIAVNVSLPVALLQSMRHFYGPFIIVLALSALVPLRAQPCCTVASGAGRMAFVGRQNSVNRIYLMGVDASCGR
jgi:hypothetical protein